MKNQKMTTRQWTLYRLLREFAESGEKKALTQEEISKLLPFYYTYKPRTNSTDCCSALWSDVNFINTHDEVEKIIIVDRFTYRLGTKQECLDFEEKYRKKAVLAFARYWKLHEKIKSNGQGKLISNQDKPIDETSKAREFVETFIVDAQKEEEE